MQKKLTFLIFTIFVNSCNANLYQSIAKENLKEIDLKSIRNIREYIATKKDAPDFLKAYEADAINERSKIK